MQEKVECKNIFKNENLKERAEAFTKTWIEIINQSKRNDENIFKK